MRAGGRTDAARADQLIGEGSGARVADLLASKELKLARMVLQPVRAATAKSLRTKWKLLRGGLANVLSADQPACGRASE